MKRKRSKHGCDLPDLILHRILIILPLKSIFISKCVSKRWNEFISTRFFRDSYNAGKEPKSTLLIAHVDERVTATYSTLGADTAEFPNELLFARLNIPFPKLPRPYDQQYVVVSSSNGLLLCRANGICYAVCNPITRQWIAILQRHQCRDIIQSREAFVAKIDKQTSKLTSYRIIRLDFRDRPLDALTMEVYSSDKKKWTQCEVPLSEKREFLISRASMQTVCFNDIIHWECARFQNESWVCSAIAYDPYKHGTNQCRMMSLPSVPNIWIRSSGQQCLLGVCCGKLQYVQVDEWSDQMAIWVCEDYDKEKWELTYMITGTRFTYCPIYFHPLDSNIVYMYRHRYPRASSGIKVFDIEERSLSHLGTVRENLKLAYRAFFSSRWIDPSLKFTMMDRSIMST